MVRPLSATLFETRGSRSVRLSTPKGRTSRNFSVTFGSGADELEPRAARLVARGDVLQDLEHRRPWPASGSRRRASPRRSGAPASRARARARRCRRGRRQAELGDQRDADAGGDEALHRGVVVGLERDPRLVAGGRAGARRSAGCTRSRAGRRSTPRRRGRRAAGCACCASGWSRGSTRNIGSSSRKCALDAVVGSLDAPSSKPSARSSSPLLELRLGVLGLAERHRQLDAGCLARKSRDRQRHQRRARRLEGGHPQAAAAQAGDRLELGLRLGQPGEDRRRRGGRAPRRPR